MSAASSYQRNSWRWVFATSRNSVFCWNAGCGGIHGRPPAKGILALAWWKRQQQGTRIHPWTGDSGAGVLGWIDAGGVGGAQRG